MNRKYCCSQCKREVLDIQLLPHPILKAIIGDLSFPRDFICAYCKDKILNIDTSPDYLEDGPEEADYQ